MFLDIIHHPVYISKHNVSETGFCLHLQVNLLSLAQVIELVPISRPALLIGPNWVGFTGRWRQNPVSKTLCSEI
jgi:hypothetical protein